MRIQSLQQLLCGRYSINEGRAKSGELENTRLGVIDSSVVHFSGGNTDFCKLPAQEILAEDLLDLLPVACRSLFMVCFHKCRGLNVTEH
jgi:hypothetical protein